MASSRYRQRHLERRGTAFFWRRRWPGRACAKVPDPFAGTALVLSLRTHVPSDAKILARRLTGMSDRVFAALAETTMNLSTDQVQDMLVKLARFEIEAFERARRIAPARSPQVAALELAREAATQETLRRALLLRDREAARAPLRHVAQLLGLQLDESSEDWRALAIEATRVLLDVSAERARRDQGVYDHASQPFQTALAEIAAEAGLGQPSPSALPGWLIASSPAPAAPVPFASSALVRAPSDVSFLPLPTAPAEREMSAPSASFEGNAAGRLVDRAALPDDPRRLGSPQLDLATAPVPQTTEPDTKPVARPLRSPGEEQVFQFYLKHLSPEAREAALRPEGPNVPEAFQIYSELKAKGFADDRFHVVQKTVASTGPNWFKSSGNKVEVGARIWTSFLGHQPFEAVDFLEIQDALDLLWRIPRDHGRGPKWASSAGYRELIERADAQEQAEATRATETLMRLGNPTKSDLEAARLAAKVKRFRTDNFLKHGRLPNAVGKMLSSLKIIHINPFSVCTWSGAEEEELRRNEEARARIAWDDRLTDLFRTPVFQGGIEEPGDPLFWAPLIARHQGCRMEEVLQLGPDDFGTDGGIPYFWVRNIDGNQVKSEAAERRLPIHTNLIDLGLMKLVDLRRRQGQRRLFPNLGRGATKGNFTELFTKVFGYYRKSHDVYWLGLDFHAFRTSFHGDLLNNHCSDAIRRRLMGHEPLDEGEKSYAQMLSMQALLTGMMAVKVDISMIQSPFSQAPIGTVKTRAQKLNIRVVGGG